SLRVVRSSRGLIRALAWTAPALVVAQITLGILTILTFKDLVPVTAHLLVAALLLADYVALLAMTQEPAPVPLSPGVPAGPAPPSRRSRSRCAPSQSAPCPGCSPRSPWSATSSSMRR